MAQFFYDANDFTVGAGLPAGWSQIVGHGNPTWAVETDATHGGNALTANNSSDALSVAGPDEVGNQTDCEIVVQYHVPDRRNIHMGCGARLSGTGDGYTAGINADGGRMWRTDAGAATSLAIVASHGQVINNLLIWTRLKVSGDSISAAQWMDGEVEPALSTVTDAAYASGMLGIVKWENIAKSWFKKIGFGTGADPAPTEPVSAGFNLDPPTLLAGDPGSNSILWTAQKP